MKLHETQATLTVSEAHWLQWSTISKRREADFANLGKRLLDVRISLAGSAFSVIKHADVYDLAVPHYMAATRLDGLEAYEREAYYDDGPEQPHIGIELSLKDQALMLNEASIGHQVACEMAPRHASGEPIELPAFDIAIAEVGGIEAGFDYAEYSTRPEVVAQEAAVNLQETLEKISLTRGIIAAITDNARSL